MFEEARERSAILMIDEIDSLLADRRHAVRTWEVSQVNEMLAQLDRFKGTLIASTNRIESMDEAAKRRFDFKIKFDFLTGDQVCALLRFHCESMGIAAPSPDVLTAASRIENATPGDFKIAEKQHRFRPSANPAEFLDVVIRECAGKSSGPSRRIGFAS
jgi:AAA+ superfamily predicted ATPase